MHGTDDDPVLDGGEQRAAERAPRVGGGLARERRAEPERHVRGVRIEQQLRELLRVPFDRGRIEVDDAHQCTSA
jgi:hypothetical protein